MSNGTIGVTISGGNANIGNIVQGNHNGAASSTQTISVEGEQAIEEFIAHLETLSPGPVASQAEIDGLKADVARLGEAAKGEKPSIWGNLLEGMKFIYEKYSWAGDMLKKLFVILIPGWVPF